MAPTIFQEKYFSRILNDINGNGHVFVDRIREQNWYTLVYDNTDVDVFYYPDLVKEFYNGIDTNNIDLDHNQFLVHLDNGDLLVIIKKIEEATQVPMPSQHVAPLPLIEYMILISAQCTELDRDLGASTTFQNVHGVGRWIQWNISSIDHTTSFNRPVLQIIHSLMTRQHTVCLNTILLQQLITNSHCTRGAKYSLPVLVTRLCWPKAAIIGFLF